MSFFTDPVYSWPSDLCDKLLECRSLSASPNSYVDVYKEEYVIKSIMKGSEFDIERLAREVDMILLAGVDCSVPLIGRYFSHGIICGFITPYRKCLTQGPEDDIRPEVHKDRLDVIQKFTTLLNQLHSKGITHGDVKPSNLVLDEAGNLRFIDFAEAVLESEPLCRHASTTHYCSPSSLKMRSPLTRADDLYAAGVSIWHIYTGHLPFGDIDEVDLDVYIKEGLCPDLHLIDDMAVRALVSKYLLDGDSAVKPLA